VVDPDLPEPGLLHDPPRPGVDDHRLGVDAVDAELAETLVDQRLRALGAVALPPGGLDEPVAEFDLTGRVVGLRPEVEPAEERALAVLGDPEAEARELLVVAQESGQVVVHDLGARRRHAAGDEPHDVRVAVERDQVVHIGLGEPAQHQPVGLQEGGHTRARVR
jgi:hypothetical protein